MRSTTEYKNKYTSPECEVVEVELERGVLIGSSRTEGVTEEDYNM